MVPRSQGLRDLLHQEVRAHVPRGHQQRLVYFRLIHTVMRESSLLAPSSYRGRDAHSKMQEMIQALARIALHCNQRVREIEAWWTIAQSHNDQFDSLLRHLFVKYAMPRFMNQVWFRGGNDVKIYLSIAKGNGPRQCGLPAKLSKAMAGHFMNAPDDLTVWQAIRWSQVLSSGGSTRLARLILKSRLGEQQDEESFWLEVINFLCQVEQAQAPTLEDREVDQVIEFVNDHRFRPAYIVLGFPVGSRLPLQPEFSLHRRSLRWFRRHQANWRNEVQLPTDDQTMRRLRQGAWQPIGIQGLRVELKDELWTIEELLTANQLDIEGGIMQHCVGGYDNLCQKGRSSIWSMRVTRGDTCKRILTIEVCPKTKKILQASGKQNKEPTLEAYRLLKKWASGQELSFYG